MATNIIRYSNRAGFQIENGHIDLTTDEVRIADYLHVESTKLYYINYYNEVVAVNINSKDFRRALFGTHWYTINDPQLETLLATGKSEATGEYGSGHSDVYVGKFFEPIAKEIGDKTLASCYAKIEEAHEAYRKKCAIQNSLLSIGSGKPIKHTQCDTTNLAADIEMFLKNRTKCLDALKPKRKRTK